MTRTPLEEIMTQADSLLAMIKPYDRDSARDSINGFLVQAFAAGVDAHRELMEAVVSTDRGSN